jgi:hypothetical protein
MGLAQVKALTKQGLHVIRAQGKTASVATENIKFF